MIARASLFGALVLAALTAPAALAASPAPAPRAPQATLVVHHDLHGRLSELARAGGEVGKAARALDKALLPHFKKEEAFALPPLSLLPALATGGPSAAMRWAVPMADRLKAERPKLIAEHQAMRAQIKALRATAHPDAVRLAGEIEAHFQQEEALLYPAALLVGQTVKAKK
jgi:hypothetical protein